MIALLTNDDGIDAAGLAALGRVAADFFDEIWTVAPAEQMSQIGHRVTTDEVIRLEKLGEKRFAVHGTPADCTRVALSHLMPQKPDWILSGINHGGNLGRHDFVISGTVAAVREGALAGVPGCAFSHFMMRGRELDWDAAGEWTSRAFAAVSKEKLKAGEFWNVNLPHPPSDVPDPEIRFCEQELHPLEVAYEEVEPGSVLYKGDYHGRARRKGSDVDVCFGGGIAISRVFV